MKTTTIPNPRPMIERTVIPPRLTYNQQANYLRNEIMKAYGRREK